MPDNKTEGTENQSTGMKGIQSPNPVTGDIIATMEAQNANLSDVYLLQKEMNQSMVTMTKLQEFANSEMRKQTTVLTQLYQYMQRKFGPAIGNSASIGGANSNTNKNASIAFDAQASDSLNKIMQPQWARQQAMYDKQTNSISKALSELTEPYKEQIKNPSALAMQELGFSDTDSKAVTELADRIEATFAAQVGTPKELSDNIISSFNAMSESSTNATDINQVIQGLDSLPDNVGDELREKLSFLDTVTDISKDTGLESIMNNLHLLPGDIANSIKGDFTGIEGIVNKQQESSLDLGKLGGIQELMRGMQSTPGSGSGVISAGGGMLGDLAGDAAGDMIGTALAAPLTAALGPLGPVAGQIIGDTVGKMLSETIGAAFDALGELWKSLEGAGRKTRDEITRAGFDKISKDVQAMGTYQIEIYRDATQQIYAAWDKNVGTATATLGYTKEALNTMQDTVAQRLQEEGYGQAINSASFLDTLTKTLDANLGGKLAEEFAYQSMVLQSAVPEVNISGMASEFAAIWTNANQQGMDGQQVMVDAMRQITGATKAIEKTTDGNNQFIQSIPNYLKKSQEIVAIAGGSVDSVAALTTQMMAAEGPLASLAPQLSGFTGELIDILTKQNDSTAVALRSIMHDINSDIGISATDFMNSFMDDTQGTLVTAFDAIDQFIERNENPAARQEFLTAMESLFGIQGDKLAQLDFGDLATQLAMSNASLNNSAMLDAEALVKAGETQTLEQQLVNNTANMLLAQNAVKDTLDNKLMRSIEQNELEMERLVWAATSTQSVDLAQNTMAFFTKLKDIIVGLLDPLGLFRAASNAMSAEVSALTNAANYAIVSNMSSIGSEVASDLHGATNTLKNTVGGAAAAIAASQASDGNAAAMQGAMSAASTAGSFQSMAARHAMATLENNQSAAQSALQAQSEASVGNYQNTVEEQKKKEEEKQREAEQKELTDQAASENQAIALEEKQREIDNHSSLVFIAGSLPELKDQLIAFTALYVETNLILAGEIREMREDGVQTIVNAIHDSKPDLSDISEMKDELKTLTTYMATYLEFIINNANQADVGDSLRMNPVDKMQIMGRGLLT